ncbi:OmpA family protein [Acidicapsa acidisoli]|uniref:OmpA family protein n=1 Tax=Acidicapsa acidisoli TaxID=1615681 RepID=UPI0021DFF2C9|nr:OmpA family protein [Acidicapsa acidisoli]
MINNFRNSSVLILAMVMCGALNAQESNPTTTPNQQGSGPLSQAEMRDGIPVYKVQVVGRDIPAINYFHRRSSTKIAFEGTSLLPNAKGTAKVEARAGRTSIEANLEGLTPANGFGNEYLTYVLWAITPEGRPVNLGEVLPTGSKDKNQITVTSNLQTFGLIITAEPYFAVTMPSDIVVVQNVVIEDKTQGVIEHVNAHYSLLPRGAYAETAGRHAVLNPITRDERSPLELYEAVNAVQIAEAAGAAQYADDTLKTAKTALKNAQDLDLHKDNRKETITFAREAVQSAEDARIITIRKLKAEDEAAQLKAKQDAEQSAQNSQADAQKSQLAAEQEAAHRAQAEAAAAEAEARAQKARDAQKAAEASAQQATAQTEQMRERLKEQLNAVLQTKETARGLIVNMSDVLFDFNKYTLKPEAREKLAKVSGILLAYPNLKLQVEGYTDNIGSDEYNQKLSEQRADGVRDYLVSQSVQNGNVTAAGFGKSDPIADNSSNAGRAQNRRVQLVVSGDAIGIQQAAPGAQSQVAPAPAPQPVDNRASTQQPATPQN